MHGRGNGRGGVSETEPKRRARHAGRRPCVPVAGERTVRRIRIHPTTRIRYQKVYSKYQLVIKQLLLEQIRLGVVKGDGLGGSWVEGGWVSDFSKKLIHEIPFATRRSWWTIGEVVAASPSQHDVSREGRRTRTRTRTMDVSGLGGGTSPMAVPVLSRKNRLKRRTTLSTSSELEQKIFDLEEGEMN